MARGDGPAISTRCVVGCVLQTIKWMKRPISVIRHEQARVQGTVTNEDSLPMAGVWAVAVPEEPKKKQHHLFKFVTTDQYGHFDLHGLAPGNYRLFSWDGVEQDGWEDTDFLKECEEKGVTIDVKDSDTKAIELKLIRVKNTATTSE